MTIKNYLFKFSLNRDAISTHTIFRYKLLQLNITIIIIYQQSSSSLRAIVNHLYNYFFNFKWQFENNFHFQKKKKKLHCLIIQKRRLLVISLVSHSRSHKNSEKRKSTKDNREKFSISMKEILLLKCLMF